MREQGAVRRACMLCEFCKINRPNPWRQFADTPVFVTELSAELNDQVVRSTPAGLTTLMIPNRLSDDEKIAALTDADFILSFGGTFSERVLRSARKLRFIQLITAGYDLMDMQLLQELYR